MGHTNPLFVENKIVKFPDIITKNQLLFVHQLINNILPHDLNCLFTYTTDIHSHYTRISNTGFLFLKSHLPILVITLLNSRFPMFGIISPKLTQTFAINNLKVSKEIYINTFLINT